MIAAMIAGVLGAAIVRSLGFPGWPAAIAGGAVCVIVWEIAERRWKKGKK